MRNTCTAVLTLLLAFAPLSAIADTWGDQINDPTRFVLLSGYGGMAVLDQETGLVWEQSPNNRSLDWQTAQAVCNKTNVGNRRGWRLPTLQELASLVDPLERWPGPALPLGHPFSNVQNDLYWSATTSAASASSAWVVLFHDGRVFIDGKDATRLVWCVRGGQGVNPQ